MRAKIVILVHSATRYKNRYEFADHVTKGNGALGTRMELVLGYDVKDDHAQYVRLLYFQLWVCYHAAISRLKAFTSPFTC